MQLVTIDRDSGRVKLSFHEGQGRTWNAARRIVLMFAGTQSGKTAFGPWWLFREYQRKGQGDYLAVSSTYDLFKLKMLPEIRYVFETILRKGKWWAGDLVMELPDPDGNYWAKSASDRMYARIILRSARAKGGLESATANAAWLDELGHPDFSLDAWQAIMRRLSLSRGRVLGTTTLYNFGWMKRVLYDPWERNERDDVDVINFRSTMNPAFPVEEYDRARLEMPTWQFDLFYNGIYTKPAGLIYNSFDDKRCVIPRFVIPDNWRRYVGMDFGGVNTVSLHYAEEPETGRLFLYKEYKAGGKTAAEHAQAIKAVQRGIPTVVGGAASEDQWRLEFSSAGLPIYPPAIKDVEVGIQRVYAAHKRNKIMVFEDCEGYIDEKTRYSRKLDDLNQPTEEIEDKSTYHFMDAERYIVGWLEDSTGLQEADQEVIQALEGHVGI